MTPYTAFTLFSGSSDDHFQRFSHIQFYELTIEHPTHSILADVLSEFKAIPHILIVLKYRLVKTKLMKKNGD